MVAGGRVKLLRKKVDNLREISVLNCAIGQVGPGHVGQNEFEEVHFSAAGENRALNYGWPIMEGAHCFRPAFCNQSGLELPVAEYDHSQGCSITGGYVYRGQRYPQLAGHYFFADYCQGTIWSLARQDGVWVQTPLLQSSLRISSFGEGVDGELYVLDHAGAVYQLQLAVHRSPQSLAL